MGMIYRFPCIVEECVDPIGVSRQAVLVVGVLEYRSIRYVASSDLVVRGFAMVARPVVEVPLVIKSSPVIVFPFCVFVEIMPNLMPQSA